MTGERLRVCIDARLEGGIAGGVQHFIAGLASGLGALEGDEEYAFVGPRGTDRWLGKHLRGACRLLVSRSSAAWRLRRSIEKRLNRARAVPDIPALPPEPAVVRRFHPDVVHFTIQSGFRTDVPNIYHPHDLQHRHLPQFFSELERLRRDAAYREMCAQSSLVAVVSTWVKEDVSTAFGVPREKIAVVPLAPATATVPDLAPDEAGRVARRLELPDRFVFYPAQTWPHKNHVSLLEALALLRRDGLTVPFVSSGLQTPHFAQIEARARELGLSDQVRFLGFVSPEELQVLYRRSTAVVIPSLFEAASFPVWEAFRVGAPVACSDVTSLPAQAGDAALLFDPRDASAIAGAVRKLWCDAELRTELIRRGRASVARFSWERTARTFRAHYRRLARRPPSPDDAALLAEAPLL